MSESLWIDYSSQRFVGEMPKICPLCHVTIHIGNALANTLANGYAQFLFECPNCRDFFIGYYSLHEDAVIRKLRNLGQLELEALKPSKPKVDNISQMIKTISPDFISIYAEASEAKEMGLNQIAGPGFRKAFEFLIKDYAKTKVTNDEKKAVEESFAGTVVNRFIKDPRIQEAAKRALWLGNDETHYLRKWTNYNIEDLITLISLTIHWIEVELLSAKYNLDMQENGKKPQA